MKVSTILVNSLSAAHTPAPAPIAPVVPSVSFKFAISTQLRMAGVLAGDVYAVKCDGYVEALFSALEAAGINYRSPEAKMLIKIYPVGGKAINVRTIGHVLTMAPGESITAWLDRVSMDERTKGVGIELAASCLTQAQVKHLYANCTAPKFDDGSTAKLVSMFTFIAPPTLAKEVKQFKRSVVEHVESVPLPRLTVPAGHVEPPITGGYIDSVGDAPTFPVEPLIPIEEPVVDSSATIIEIDGLEARTLRELGLLWKSEFGYNVPSKIRHADLCLLIEAKRDSSF